MSFPSTGSTKPSWTVTPTTGRPATSTVPLQAPPAAWTVTPTNGTSNQVSDYYANYYSSYYASPYSYGNTVPGVQETSSSAPAVVPPPPGLKNYYSRPPAHFNTVQSPPQVSHSYNTTVAAPPVTSSSSSSMSQFSRESWPPSLKGFVDRTFTECSTSAQRDDAEVKLKRVLLHAIENGTLRTKDWSKYTMAQVIHEIEHGAPSPSPKKRKPRWDLKGQAPTNVDTTKNENRRLRFGDMLNTVVTDKHAHQSHQLSLLKIEGTCEKLEKSYYRLTSAPDPTTVRPARILEKSLAMVLEKAEKKADIHYLNDQLKSIRQDLTVQRIKSELTVKVYESHARIALAYGDLGEYNQCQSQLKMLYEEDFLPGCREEFFSYRLLYMLHTKNTMEVALLLQYRHMAKNGLFLYQFDSPLIQHALSIKDALFSHNYHRFFRLYRTCPLSGQQQVLKHVLERERLFALNTICAAYRPDVSFSFVIDELAFTDAKEAHEYVVDQLQLTLVQDRLDTKNSYSTIAHHLVSQSQS